MSYSYIFYQWEYVLIKKLIHCNYANIDLVVNYESHANSKPFLDKTKEQWKYLIFNFYFVDMGY